MSIVDKEFGEIKIRKNKFARSVKLSVGVDGSLRASIRQNLPFGGLLMAIAMKSEKCSQHITPKILIKMEI